MATSPSDSRLASSGVRGLSVPAVSPFPRHIHKQAKRVQQSHLLRTFAPYVQQRRVTNQQGQTPRPRDGHDQPVPDEKELKVPGISSPLEVAIEKKQTAASWPRNLSTVPTLTLCCGAGRPDARHRHQSL